MIQRIQTIYLLIVAIFSVVMMSLPVGNLFLLSIISFQQVTNLALVVADGTPDYAPWALFALLIVIAVVSLVTIFLYRKRMLQIRLTLFNIILLIGYYVTMIVFVFMLKDENSTFVPSWSVCLPLISIILNWLAIRAIGKDEMLVKAYERLR